MISGLAGKSAILDTIGIFFAKYLAYLMGLAFLFILLAQKDWRRRLHLCLFSAVSLIVSYGIIEHAINYFFPTARPFVELNFTPLVMRAADASFPSAHATIFFTMATLLFFWISRKWGVWFFAGALLIGVGRIFVGLHYPIDILGGALIGIVTPFLVAYVFKQYDTAVPESKLEKIEP